MLPTIGIPSNPEDQRRCRGGCDKVESLSHVLQRCPVTHWRRINRHDRICKLLKDDATNKNFNAENEPHIRCESEVLQKPDLILTKDEEVIICDVVVNWEGSNSLKRAYQNKRATYTTPGFLQVIEEQYNTKNIQIHAFIMNVRGIWCANYRHLISVPDLNTNQMNTITTDTMKGSMDIHSDFGSQVWTSSGCRTKPNGVVKRTPAFFNMLHLNL